MSTPNLAISAHQAAQMVAAGVRKTNQRIVPDLPPRLQRLSKEEQIYIFNVGPWPQARNLGSLGTFFIKACEEGKEHSPALVIPGIVVDPYPQDGPTMRVDQEDGEYIAQQVLGVGKHLPPSQSLVKYGVFISRTNPPSKKELSEARARLNEYYRELVDEADKAYAKGPVAAEQTIQPDLHFLAAHKLHLTATDCPWLKNAIVATERKNCEGCGSVYDVGIMLCRSCGFILDPEKYAKNKDRFAK